MATRGYVEHELRFFVDERVPKPRSSNVEPAHFDAATLVKSLWGGEISQEMNLISGIQTKSGCVKRLVFENGVQQHDKRTITNKTVLFNTFGNRDNIVFKFAISREKEVDDAASPSLARTKLRSSTRHGDWRLDITLVRESDVDIKVLTASRDLMFKQPFEEALKSANFIEFEMEYVGTASFKLASIDDATRIFAGLVAPVTSQPTSHVAEAGTLTGKQGRTIKQIAPQVVEMTRKVFFGGEFDVAKYAVTDKADGQRDLLLFKDGVCHSVATGKSWNVTLPENMTPALLDCEALAGPPEIYLVFDAAHVGQSLLREPLASRLSAASDLIQAVISSKAGPELHLKEFVYPKTRGELVAYQTGLRRDYEIDGIIFTPFTATYWTPNYKWKPPNRMSIDFLLKRCDHTGPYRLGVDPCRKIPNKTLYLLHVGASRNSFVKRCRVPTSQYGPTLFSPSSGPLAFLFWHERDDLHNTVCELVPESIDMPCPWRLCRVREDRAKDVETQRYFGNDIEVAESIWNSLIAPFELKETAPQSYFAKPAEENTLYLRKAMRYVISSLFRGIGTRCIDLGSGNGQDIFRYEAQGVKQLLCVERDALACQELLSRWSHRTKVKGRGDPAAQCMRLGLLKVDMHEQWSELLKKIQMYEMTTGIDSIVCNLALHYFGSTAAEQDNIVGLIAALKPGKFIYTAFDQQRVIAALKSVAPAKVWERGPYRIECKSQAKIDEILVKLPFSDELVAERLIAEASLERKMSKIHYKITKHGFDSWLEQLAKTQPALAAQLLDDDRAFLSLYTAVVFEKDSTAQIYRNGSRH